MRNTYPFALLFLALVGPLSCVDEENQPRESVCGDGLVDWQRGEDCDGVNLEQDSCASLGYYDHLGVLRCAPDCRFDVSECGGTCGDQVRQPERGEACDGDDLGGATCESLGLGGGILRCLNDCTFFQHCDGVCGNGIRENADGCDDGNLEDGDGCDADCVVETGWACGFSYSPNRCWPDCGDGLAIADEECDGDDLRGQTCESMGFSGGTLDCTFFTCEYNLRDCVE